MLTRQRCLFRHRRRSEGFHGSCQDLVSSPDRMPSLSCLSASLDRLVSSRRPRSHPAVLVRSSNRVPSGQLRFTQARNQPALLDPARSGFSSLLAASSLHRVTDDARPSPEGLVSPASARRPCGLQIGGAEPTSLTQPFPSCLGLSRDGQQRPCDRRRSSPFFQGTGVIISGGGTLTTKSYAQDIHRGSMVDGL